MERQRQKIAIFGVLAGVVGLLAAVLVVRSTHVTVGAVEQSPGDRLADVAYLAPTEASVHALLAAPHYLTVRYPHNEGEPFYLEVVAQSNPKAPRARTKLSCQRMHFRLNRGVCVLPPSNSLGTKAVVFDERLQAIRELDLLGSPSRVRVSNDARYAATSNFISGHSYADSSFVTATTFIELATGASSNLESWDAFEGQRRVDDKTRNYWGVTFLADNTFYATLGIGPKRYLIKGDPATKTLRVIRDNTACPSVSPDGQRLTFRRAIVEPDGSTAVPLYLLDLRTGLEQRLPERLNIDDQPEWLDNHRIAYGTPTGPPNAVVIDVDATGDARRPTILIPDAVTVAVT